MCVCVCEGAQARLYEYVWAFARLQLYMWASEYICDWTLRSVIRFSIDYVFSHLTHFAAFVYEIPFGLLVFLRSGILRMRIAFRFPIKWAELFIVLCLWTVHSRIWNTFENTCLCMSMRYSDNWHCGPCLNRSVYNRKQILFDSDFWAVLLIVALGFIKEFLKKWNFEPH